MNMKKLMTFVLSAVMVLSLTACGQSAAQPQSEKNPAENNEEIPNPFTAYDTLEEAAEAVGFDINVPDMLEGFDTREIQCSDGGMLEVSYWNADGEKVSIRKALGNDDISGDYNEYAEESSETVSGQEVLFKGDDGKVSTAVWTNKDSTYAIFSSEGMEKDDVTALVETVSVSADDAPAIGGDPATWGPALEENAQCPSPFTDCETLEEAIGITGFDMVVPEMPESYDQTTIQVVSGNMIQVIYRKDTDESAFNDADESIFIRKMPGSDDISGDYNTYAQIKTVSVGDVEVSMKGEQDLVYLATWTSDGYTYAVSARSGLPEAAMADLVAETR